MKRLVTLVAALVIGSLATASPAQAAGSCSIAQAGIAYTQPNVVYGAWHVKCNVDYYFALVYQYENNGVFQNSNVSFLHPQDLDNPPGTEVCSNIIFNPCPHMADADRATVNCRNWRIFIQVHNANNGNTIAGPVYSGRVTKAQLGCT